MRLDEVVKLFVQLSAFVVFIWLFVYISIDYFSYATLTEFTLIQDKDIKSPAVSICLRSTFKGSSEFVIEFPKGRNARPMLKKGVNFNCEALFGNENHCESFKNGANHSCFRFNRLNHRGRQKLFVIPFQRFLAFNIYVHERDRFPAHFHQLERFPGTHDATCPTVKLIYRPMITDESNKESPFCERFKAYHNDSDCTMTHYSRFFSVMDSSPNKVMSFEIFLEEPAQKFTKILKFDFVVYVVYVGGFIGCVFGYAIMDTKTIIAKVIQVFEKVKSAISRAQRAGKAVFYLTCFLGFLWQLGEVCEIYFTYDVITNSNLCERMLFEKPDVHICHQDRRYLDYWKKPAPYFSGAVITDTIVHVNETLLDFNVLIEPNVDIKRYLKHRFYQFAVNNDNRRALDVYKCYNLHLNGTVHGSAPLSKIGGFYDLQISHRDGSYLFLRENSDVPLIYGNQDFPISGSLIASV